MTTKKGTFAFALINQHGVFFYLAFAAGGFDTLDLSVVELGKELFAAFRR